MTIILELAVSAGELRLASADPNQKPHLAYRYLEDEQDRQRAREAVRICQRLLTHRAFEPIVDRWLAPAEQDLASDQLLDSWLLPC